ncbi:MAG: hypothetical protein ACYTG0_23930 [Planctomycetota bacterium]|jgi:type IV secretory pathway VirB10-like protein
MISYVGLLVPLAILVLTVATGRCLASVRGARKRRGRVAASLFALIVCGTMVLAVSTACATAQETPKIPSISPSNEAATTAEPEAKGAAEKTAAEPKAAVPKPKPAPGDDEETEEVEKPIADQDASTPPAGAVDDETAPKEEAPKEEGEAGEDDDAEAVDEAAGDEAAAEEEARKKAELDRRKKLEALGLSTVQKGRIQGLLQSGLLPWGPDEKRIEDQTLAWPNQHSWRSCWSCWSAPSC